MIWEQLKQIYIQMIIIGWHHFLKALGHPARIAILQYIISQKACICNDLVEELGLAQATISQHLKS